jgi:hypothetical protein
VLACRPELVNDVPPVPPTFVNGPDEDVELNTVYHTAPGEAVQDTAIEFDDFAVAVTPVGAAGGGGSVVADAGGLDISDPPLLFQALTT